MRHRRAVNKLGRNTSNRKALMRSLVRSLFISERISTNYVKAKEASSLADKLISLGKKNTITSKKTAIEILGSKELINKLFDDIAPRYASRNGGYTRVLQTVHRKGDGSKMGLLELTERVVIEKTSTKKSLKKEKEGKPDLPAKEKKESDKAGEPESQQPGGAKEKVKDYAKSKKDKHGKGFFKDLRQYFKRKSM